MAITPFRPATEIFRPLFDDLFEPMGGDGSRLGNMMRAPAADVTESENEIRVLIEVPGVRSEDVEIDLENNVLTISGEKHEQRQEGSERDSWHLSERRYGKFSRSFVLPRDVEQESIQARLEEGVLTVRIPKSERARRRRISIEGGGDRQQVETKTGG